MKNIFYYTFLNNKLFGSEDPSLHGKGLNVVKEFSEQHNIGHLITLTPEYEDFKLEKLTQYHVPMLNLPSIKEAYLLFGIIDRALQSQEPVWVHCKKGIDRTGAVIGAYLVYKEFDAETVVQELLTIFKVRFPHPRFEELWQDKADFIRSFAISK